MEPYIYKPCINSKHILRGGCVTTLWVAPPAWLFLSTSKSLKLQTNLANLKDLAINWQIGIDLPGSFKISLDVGQVAPFRK